MIDGQIAGTAREFVRQQRQPDAEHKDETSYRMLCEGLPILLRTAGLARTVTFLSAKKRSSPEYAALLGHLQSQLQAAGVYSKERQLDLAAWVITERGSSAEYRNVSRLAFRVAYWHKRLAQALLRKKDEK